MTKNRSDQRNHRRKVANTAKGAAEHVKREKRRKKQQRRNAGATREVERATMDEGVE